MADTCPAGDVARGPEEVAVVTGEAQRAVDLAVQVVPGCDAAGLSRVWGRRVRTVASTHALVETGDQLQYDLGEGPCLDALREEDLVLTADLGPDPRWPRWAPRAHRELGVRSMLAVRLFTSDATVGALNCYGLQRGAFDEEAVAVLRSMAAQASAALAAADTIDNLHVAVAHRTTIGQAQGILMERFALDPTQAFAVLTRLSQHRNEKLHDLAAQVVATRELPEGPGAG